MKVDLYYARSFVYPLEREVNPLPPTIQPEGERVGEGSRVVFQAMSIKVGSKYYPLYTYLQRRWGTTVDLSFERIEQLLGERLPPSARSNRAFWSNRIRGGFQAAAWMESGFHVLEVDLKNERVIFGQPVLRYTVQREGDNVRWDSGMVRALREYLGLSQAEMATVLGVRQQTVSEWETSSYVPTRSRSKHLSMVAERAGFPVTEGDQIYVRKQVKA